MIKHLSFFAILFFASVLLGCNGNKPEIPSKDIWHSGTFPTELSMPTSMDLVNGYFVVSDMFGADGMVDVYNNNGKLVAKIAPKGESGNEVLEVSGLDHYSVGQKTYLNIYDLEKRKMLTYDFSSLTTAGHNKSFPVVKNFISDNRYYGICKLQSGYAAMGTFEDYKFDILDPSLRLIGKYGDYLPNKEEVKNKMINASANYGKSVVSPDKTLLVNITYAAGVLRFYSVKGNVLHHEKDAIVEPMDFKVKGTDYENNQGMGFLSAAISNKYVYAVYSGEKEDPNVPTPVGQYVYKYDYNGNLLNIYRLDKPTFSIVVDMNDKHVYTIVDDHGYKIYSYKM